MTNIEAIPKIRLTDKTTWMEAETVAISAVELYRYGKRLETQEYFRDRKVIILGILPDESEYNYEMLLDHFFDRVKPIAHVIITTADCACYNDMIEWANDELKILQIVNQELLQRFLAHIGILKGYDASTYRMIQDSLKDQPGIKAYLVYITGELRSNPRYFSLQEFFNTNFPQGLDKPVYLHGCSIKLMKQIPKLKVDVQGIITAGHITDAIYRGNPHYKRETRINKSWEKWNKAIQNIV